MSDRASKLESLARLTRENSEEGRQQLLHEVTNLFMAAPESLSEREVAYFGDIMGRIVVDVETQVRQHLSETIANVNNAPHDLIASLAHDEIEVALPVLTSSEVLGDKDLVRVVGDCSQDHLRAISMRASVNEQVTDALVVKGNDTVLETLADNDGARFSRGGMETIVDRADGNDALSQKLVLRHDVPDDMTKEMFWRVSWAMREQILDADASLDAAEIDTLMKETEQWFDAQEKKRRHDPVDRFIARKEAMNQLNNELLIELIRQEKVPEFIAAVGRLARIEPETARQAVFDPSGEKMAIVCKALDVNYDVFGEFLMLTDFDGSRSMEDTKSMLGIYQRIKQEWAQRALRFLRSRKIMQKKVTDPPPS